MNSRSIFFNLVDFVRGGNIKRHLSEVESVMASNLSDFALDYQRKKKEDLVHHAKNTTSFYKNFSSFESFPIIDKNIIRQNLNDFLSNSFEMNQLRRVSTSGSTGTPFEIFQNKDKQNRQTAENIFFNRICGFSLGDKLYFLRIWNDINRISSLNQIIKNIVPVEISDLSINKTQELIQSLTANRSRKSLLAYSSTYEALARNFNALGIDSIDANVSAIITMSEELDALSRAKLELVFSCGVFSRYSNSENGFIAHQVPLLGNSYLVNHSSFVVELLDIDKDEPVEDGKPGRIVVTDLFNYALPMIRYDTGDIAIAGTLEVEGRKHRVLKSIEGRRLDFIVRNDGGLISPHVIDYALRRFVPIRQFQIVQKDFKVYELRINKINESELVEDEVLKALKEYLESDSAISIIYVDEVPLLKSGKRKIVVNEMNLPIK